MKVLILEPGKLAREAEIEHSLEAMQKVVGGPITAIYPYEEPVAVVCNDEGLLMGLPLNRRLRRETTIAGTFFVCGLGEEDFIDLSPELMGKFKVRLRFPHCFIRAENGDIIAVPCLFNEEE